MRTITTTDALAEFCAEAARAPYVTVDTEFLRERTYWSKLCLVQLALPGDGAPGGADGGAGDGQEGGADGALEGDAVLVDPILGEEMSLQPLYDLMADRAVVKVFHAARQDLEIFHHEGGVLPEPLFDTQVAAMVCGFGEQVGYETLVKKIAKASVDKTSRFTDWSRRPLSEAQKAYALADVTHLRGIYEYLAAELDRSGRRGWVEEELGVLTDPATYVTDPETAWRRVKTRTNSGRFLAVVRELAKFRETYAQARNIPRNRVFKDDAMLELASTKPASIADLGKSRMLLRDARKGPIADGIVAAVAAGLDCPREAWPELDDRRDRMQVNPALADLLRVLLKAKAESAGVAQKLIASAADLDAIASGDREVPALRGWRREVFGADALRLCDGEIALTARGALVEVVTL